MTPTYDVIIIGGGPAGLSAALWLGRCRRNVILCDAGHGRNYAAQAVHGFLTRDGITPQALRNLARADLKKYNVHVRDTKVVRLQKDKRGGFIATLASRAVLRSRIVLLTTGMIDQLPDIPGFEACYGKGVFHCPYCDGWENRDKHLVAFGSTKHATAMAAKLKRWSATVTACTHGGRPSAALRRSLESKGIDIRTQRVTRLLARRGRLHAVVFATGETLACDAVFFHTQQFQRSALIESIGCRLTKKGAAIIDRKCCTNIEGLYIAGDATKDVQFVVTAASEGARAAVAINKALQAIDEGD